MHRESVSERTSVSESESGEGEREEIERGQKTESVNDVKATREAAKRRQQNHRQGN